MNQRVAKRIRRIIYGSNSHRPNPDYGLLQIPGIRGRITGQLVCRGLRERYQAAKRLHKQAKRAGRTDAWIFGAMKSEAAILRLHEQGGLENVGQEEKPAYGA